jgi:hypothetical protein
MSVRLGVIACQMDNACDILKEPPHQKYQKRTLVDAHEYSYRRFAAQFPLSVRVELVERFGAEKMCAPLCDRKIFPERSSTLPVRTDD